MTIPNAPPASPVSNQDLAAKTGIDRALSEKLRALSFLGIVMVVIGHSPSFRDPAAPSVRSEGYAFFEFLFADALPRIVVMLFFAASGFLFFAGHDGTKATQLRKIQSRLLSLGVPYLIWSAIAIGVYFALQNLPWTSSWFTNPARRIAGRPVLEVFLIWLFDPIAYQLWFLRDLIFLAVASPLLFWCLRHAGVVTVAVLFVLHVFDLAIPSPVPHIRLITGDGYFYFALGGLFAMKRWPTSGKASLTLSLGLLAVAIAIFRSWNHLQLRIPDVWLFKAVHAIGVPALWFLYDRSLRWMERPAIQRISGLAFFVFVAHEPLMSMLRKPITRILGTGDLRHAAELLLTLFLTLAVVLPLGTVLRAKTPRIYGFLTGGRIG